MPKLLCEFLQEQQEPFALDIYLVERGYSSSSFQNRALFLNNSWLRKKKDVVPNCTGFAKAVFSRLILHSDRKEINGGREDSESATDECGDEDEFSSANDDILCEETVDADRKLKWRSMTMEEDSQKQLSPVSVLQQTESQHEASSPLHHKNDKFKRITEGESSLPLISECKPKQPTHTINSIASADSYDQYIINKRALRRSKELLIDCVREVIEKHGERDNRKTGQQLKKILGAEELWKLVCENVWHWSQDPIDETNIFHLLKHDFMACQQDWTFHSHLHKQELSMEIGDAILEAIITETLF